MARLNEQEVIQELSQEESTQELAATTTSSGQFDRLQAEEWLEQVVYDAEPRRRLLELSREHELSQGSKATTIPRTQKALDMSGDNTKAEGDSRNYTEMDTLDGEHVEITDDNFKEGAMRISKQKVITTPVDVMETARAHLARQIARDVDVQLRDEIITEVGNIVTDSSNAPTDGDGDTEFQYVTDSDSGHVVDQTQSERLTPDSIAEAAARIEANDWEPFALVISSDHKKDLRTDSQFTNAAEYGSQDVILNGEIGQYLDVRVVVSNTIGDEAIMVGREAEGGQDVAQAVVWKEMPEVNHEFQLEENEHRFYYDQTFETAVVQPTALATIQTA